jgi:hypothetical protein
MYGMKVSIQATSLTDADVAGWGDVTQIAKCTYGKSTVQQNPAFLHTIMSSSSFNLLEELFLFSLSGATISFCLKSTPLREQHGDTSANHDDGIHRDDDQLCPCQKAKNSR